jgi:hypothetical protein
MAKRNKKKRSNKKRRSGGGGSGRLPFGSYDPNLDAEERSIGRGFRDLRQDTRRDIRRGKLDRNESLRDLGISRERGTQDLGFDFLTTMQDLGIDRQRAEQDLRNALRYGREDLGTRLQRGLAEAGRARRDIGIDLARGEEDWTMNIRNLTTQYSRLARGQQESANAAGVYGGGTDAASASARAENFAIEREPLDIAIRRLREDVSRETGDIGTHERELRQDYSRDKGRLESDTYIEGLRNRQDFGINKGRATYGYNTGSKRLEQDYRLDTQGVNRDFRELKQDARTQLSRGKREKKLGKLDIRKQKFYQAQGNNPAAFKKYAPKKLQRSAKSNERSGSGRRNRFRDRRRRR